MVASPVPVAASVRVAGNFSGVVPEPPESEVELSVSPESPAANTIGVSAVPAATAPPAAIMPRRDRERFLR
ncbi:hypothetical protein ACFVJ4_30875 [Streptomyces sp. NPDC127178]|uniref:hypothetical protein n=1 Tax=unclassified Streptomyces TaxID=2593676 RepID=UPI00362E3629